MSYYFTITNGPFNTIEKKTVSLLKHIGFSVLTEIDMQEALKQKLGVNFKSHKILGACNPPVVYRALTAENKIGRMLPCNVILQENASNEIEVSAINPLIPMQSIANNTALHRVAKAVSAKLKQAIKNLRYEK